MSTGQRKNQGPGHSQCKKQQIEVNLSIIKKVEKSI